jgi:hypothetical protein
VTYTKRDRVRVLGERAQATPEEVSDDEMPSPAREEVSDDDEMLSPACEEASDDDELLSPAREEASDDELLSPAREEVPNDYLLSPRRSRRISDIYEGSVSHHAPLRREGHGIHAWTDE